jgi:hypothetical protein
LSSTASPSADRQYHLELPVSPSRAIEETANAAQMHTPSCCAVRTGSTVSRRSAPLPETARRTAQAKRTASVVVLTHRCLSLLELSALPATALATQTVVIYSNVSRDNGSPYSATGRVHVRLTKKTANCPASGSLGTNTPRLRTRCARLRAAANFFVTYSA